MYTLFRALGVHGVSSATDPTNNHSQLLVGFIILKNIRGKEKRYKRWAKGEGAYTEDDTGDKTPG